MKIAILAAGDYPKRAYPLYLLNSSDVLVCCDSAYNTAVRKGLKPCAVVGDMDSIKSNHNFKNTEQNKVEFVHVTEQDYNDLTKAMRYVMERFGSQIQDIYIFGATGKHEAHTMGNLSLLMEYEQWWGFWEKGINIQIVSDYCSAFAIADTCSLQVGEGRKISFFCYDKTLRISTKGLQWPLDEFEFGALWKATLNKSTSDTIDLRFNHPTPVLIIME